MPCPRPLLQSTVLVVEGDEMLRMCAVVVHAGFTPDEAANAHEAFCDIGNRSDIRYFSRTSKCPAAWTA